MGDPEKATRREFLAAGTSAAVGIGLTGCLGPREAARPPLARMSAVAPPAPGFALDELEPVLREIVADLEKQVPYASALVLCRGTTSIAIDDETQEVKEPFPSAGAVLSAFNGQWIEETATSDLTPEGLQAAARSLAAGLRRMPQRHEIDPGPEVRRRFATPCRTDPRSLAIAELFERVVDLHRRARARGTGFVNTTVQIAYGVDQELFVNRRRALGQEIVRTRVGASYFAASDAGTVHDYENRGGTGGLEVAELADADLEALAAETRALAAARPLAPGPRDLVLDGSLAGTLAHESFGHGVELDMFVKDRALAESFVGKRVGSDLVNIFDDPSLQGAIGGYFFDHEGEIAGPTHIVKDGIFVRGLSDLMSATLLGVPRSANGRRQDFRRKAYARMSNTFFGRGRGSVEELIAGVGDGLLVRKLSHGMEDPKGWGILVVGHVGEEIRDGRLTGVLHSPVGITGYVPEVLASVSGVAGDFATGPGYCGKGHKEFVVSATGGPHIRLRAIAS